MTKNHPRSLVKTSFTLEKTEAPDIEAGTRKYQHPWELKEWGGGDRKGVPGGR